MNEHFSFETKCRRCGKIHTWAWGLAKQSLIGAFINNMVDRFDHAETAPCTKCKKDTIQDIVSFDPKIPKQWN